MRLYETGGQTRRTEKTANAAHEDGPAAQQWTKNHLALGGIAANTVILGRC